MAIEVGLGGSPCYIQAAYDNRFRWLSLIKRGFQRRKGTKPDLSGTVTGNNGDYETRSKPLKLNFLSINFTPALLL